jgi:hypothetical protein
MMETGDGSITLNDEDLKELFSLFTSPTKYELEQVYDEKSEHYFAGVDLFDEYTLTEEKREYALDAWRAVTYFLHSRGYSLSREGRQVSLSFSESEFIP